MEVTNTAGSSTAQKCTSCEGPEVSGWCVECGEALCKECVSAHKRVKMTRSHTIRTQPESGVFSLSSPGFCPIHKQEPIKLFCFSCSQLTCRDCQLMDHRSHSFQFIHEAMDTQRKSLDSLVQSVRTQREEVRQSLLDLDGRLEDIEHHKSRLRISLQKAQIIFSRQFKKRLLNLYIDAVRVYQSEIDVIDKRKAELRTLEERQEYIAEFTEKAIKEEHFPSLLSNKAQIDSQLREILSHETKPTESMIKLNLLAKQSVYSQLFSFGEVCVSTVPFSLSQPRPDKSSSAVPENREGPSAAVVHTSSSGPQITSAPPASHLPASHLPASHLPASHLPASHLPASHLPASHLPASHLPASHLPASHLPASHLPAHTGNSSDADPFHLVMKPSTSQQVLSNQSCLPIPPRPNVCQLNTNETLPTPVSHPVSQCPPISNPVQTSLVLIRDSQLSSIPANHAQPNSSLENRSTQASTPSTYTQSSITTANPSQAYVVTEKLQSSLVPKLNSIPATTTTNHSQSSTVTVTDAQFPVSDVYYALPSFVLYSAASSAQPQNPALLSHSQSSTISLNYYQTTTGSVTLDQHSMNQVNYGQLTEVAANHSESSSVQVNQCLKTNHGQFSLVPVQYDQPSLVTEYQIINLNHTQPNKDALLHQSSPVVLNKCQSSPVVLNQGQSSPFVINQGQSSPAILRQGQANGAPESLEKHSMVSTKPRNETLSGAVSPSFTLRSRSAMDNHPILLTHLMSNKSAERNSEEKGGRSTLIPPDNPDRSTADTDQLLTSHSIVQSRVLNQTILSTPYQQPTRTVKAVADSACDSSTPLVSDPTAASQHPAGENEPTSTVTDIETTEMVYCTLPSDFLLACDDINAYITLSCESDSKDTSTRKAAPSPAFGTGEVTMTGPESQSSSRTIKCETDLMSFDDIASVSPQSHWSSTQPHLAKDGHRIDRLKEERDSTSHGRRPIRLSFRRKSRGSRSIWKVGMPINRRLQEKRSSPSLVCELPFSVELSSIDGYNVCNSRKWQPRVSLFQLPISNPTPDGPLPRFLLLPGDGKDEIHLQEIDEDNQSHEDDFMEPLPSPESPPLLQLVLCAACGALKGSIVCVLCGRGFHRDCHIPEIGPSVWQEWKCSLCQDLSDPRDPYSDERGKTPCLSLLDQRRCEHLLLDLICENSSSNLYHTDEPSCASAHLQSIRERLSLQRSPPYRTPSEFVSDIWVFLETWSTSKEHDEAHTKLQCRLQNKLVKTFGTELHPSLLTQPNASPITPTEIGESAVVLMHLSPCLTEEVKEAGSEQGTEASNNKVTEEAEEAGSEGTTTEMDADTSHTETDKEAKPLCLSRSDSNTNLTEALPEGKSLTTPHTSQTERGEAPKLSETRKRLLEFLSSSHVSKKLKMEKDQDKKFGQDDDDDGLDKMDG